MRISALIPAYNPPHDLPGFVRRLAATEIGTIIVVNDGSSWGYAPIFRELDSVEKVTLIRHPVNRGKGAALKTGLDYAYKSCEDTIGVVTADADGQHSVDDILEVARVLTNHPKHLVIGVRSFDKKTPLRSRIGNGMTRCLFGLITGRKLSDTQTGLRGIPGDFIPQLLKSGFNGYEFELDMLLSCLSDKRPITEQEIRTIYFGNNSSSHFNPLLDSLKVYLVLFRFVLHSRKTVSDISNLTK